LKFKWVYLQPLYPDFQDRLASF